MNTGECPQKYDVFKTKQQCCNRSTFPHLGIHNWLQCREQPAVNSLNVCLSKSGVKLCLPEYTPLCPKCKNCVQGYSRVHTVFFACLSHAFANKNVVERCREKSHATVALYSSRYFPKIVKIPGVPKNTVEQKEAKNWSPPRKQASSVWQRLCAWIPSPTGAAVSLRPPPAPRLNALAARQTFKFKLPPFNNPHHIPTSRPCNLASRTVVPALTHARQRQRPSEGPASCAGCLKLQ